VRLEIWLVTSLTFADAIKQHPNIYYYQASAALDSDRALGAIEMEETRREREKDSSAGRRQVLFAYQEVRARYSGYANYYCLPAVNPISVVYSNHRIDEEFCPGTSLG
jgi:hypothetical protein